FVGRLGAEVLARLNGVAASTGSTCHAGHVELSPVLRAMGVAPEVALGAIRFSLGRGSTREEIDTVADQLASILTPAPSQCPPSQKKPLRACRQPIAAGARAGSAKSPIVSKKS